MSQQSGPVTIPLAGGEQRSVSSRDPDHLGYVDAIRGVAFMLVLFYHCRGNIQGLPTWFGAVVEKGNYGVQLFYVASAFTLFLSLHQRAGRDARPILFFFIRRFFRIAPLFWAAIIFFILHYGLGPRGAAPLGIGIPHIISTALFMHGWHPTTINSVVPVGWSIAVEMTFYLFVPLFYHHVRSLRRMVTVFLALLVFSRISSWTVRRWLWGSMDPIFHDCVNSFVYYWLPAQMPVFCLGFILFFIIRSPTVSALSSSPAKRRWALLLMGAALLLAGLLICLRIPTAFIGFAVVGVIVTLSLSFQDNRLLVNRVTRYAGKVSYSGYLTHDVAISMVSSLGIWDGKRLPLPPLLLYVVHTTAALLLTLLISTVTYRLIEEPGRNIGRKLIQRIKSADVARAGGLDARLAREASARKGS